MTPEQQKYIQQNKPERFFRVQAEVPPAVALNIETIKIEVCHQGKYTGNINADGTPSLDTSDIPLDTVINLGTISEISERADNSTQFNEACQVIFNEINKQATFMVEQERLNFDSLPNSDKS